MNTTAAALLGLLADHDGLTGAELARAAAARIGSYWPVTRSQVYRELAALDEQGLVSAGSRGPRDARPYTVSPAGTSALRDWLAAMPTRDDVRMSLLVAVTFGRHLPAGRLEELLDQTEQLHRATLAEYEELAGELDRGDADAYVQATLSFGLLHERAVLTWLAALPPEIRRQG